jgi:hypothetical protein
MVTNFRDTESEKKTEEPDDLPEVDESTVGSLSDEVWVRLIRFDGDVES